MNLTALSAEQTKGDDLMPVGSLLTSKRATGDEVRKRSRPILTITLPLAVQEEVLNGELRRPNDADEELVISLAQVFVPLLLAARNLPLSFLLLETLQLFPHRELRPGPFIERYADRAMRPRT